jgi:hypothetical protein
VLAALFWWDLRSKEQELATLTTQISDSAEPVKRFQAVIDRVQGASPWFDQRPPTLESFLEVTKAFPDVATYATQFSITSPDAAGGPSKLRVAGRGPAESEIFAMGDRLRANPKFSNVSVEVRSAGQNSREIIFTLTCNYSDKPLTPAQRNATRPANPAGAGARTREARK